MAKKIERRKKKVEEETTNEEIEWKYKKLGEKLKPEQIASFELANAIGLNKQETKDIHLSEVINSLLCFYYNRCAFIDCKTLGESLDINKNKVSQYAIQGHESWNMLCLLMKAIGGRVANMMNDDNLTTEQKKKVAPIWLNHVDWDNVRKFIDD